MVTLESSSLFFAIFVVDFGRESKKFGWEFGIQVK